MTNLYRIMLEVIRVVLGTRTCCQRTTNYFLSLSVPINLLLLDSPIPQLPIPPPSNLHQMLCYLVSPSHLRDFPPHPSISRFSAIFNFLCVPLLLTLSCRTLYFHSTTSASHVTFVSLLALVYCPSQVSLQIFTCSLSSCSRHFCHALLITTRFDRATECKGYNKLNMPFFSEKNLICCN